MKYTVQNTTLLHNGKRYPEGDVIELTKKEAEKLSDFLVPNKEESSQENQGDKKDKNSKNNKDKYQENLEDEKDKGDNLNTSTNQDSTQSDGGIS